MKNHLILYIFFILVVLPVSFGVDFPTKNMTGTAYFRESFNYSAAYASKGWYYTESTCGSSFPDHPSNNSFYANYSGCVLNGDHQLIAANFSQAVTPASKIDFSANYFTIRYRSYHNEECTNEVQVRDMVSGSFKLNIENDGFTNTTIVQFYEPGSKNITVGSSSNAWNIIDLYMDFTGDIYYLKQNGELLYTGTLSASADEYYTLYLVQECAPNNLDIAYISDFVLNITERAEEEVVSQYSDGVLFCDDFNYAGSMYDAKGWLVMEHGLAVNTDYAPVDNMIIFDDYAYYSPRHTTGSYSYTYQTGEHLYVSSTIFSPVFSSEMLINITGTLNDSMAACFEYIARNGADELVYDVRLCPNTSAYYFNDTGYPIRLCDNCVPYNTDFPFKVITYLGQKAGMSFNSTVSDKISVYINNTQYDITTGYWTDKITTLGQYYIIKNEDAQYTIDDYCVYVGTDKYVNNLDYYFKSSYSPVNETIIVPSESGDLLENIMSLYDFLGLRSTGSRVIAGIIILVVCNMMLLFFAFYNQAEIPSVVYAVLNILGLIFLIYIGLLPYWIPIIIGVVVIAGVMFMFLRAITSN